MGNTAATGNVLLMNKRDTALAATKAAFDMKETMLTAYCVQAVALGAAAADLKDGKEPSASYDMGSYKTAADSYGNQFGKLTAGSNDAAYRCYKTGGSGNYVAAT